MSSGVRASSGLTQALCLVPNRCPRPGAAASLLSAGVPAVVWNDIYMARKIHRVTLLSISATLDFIG